MTRGAASQPLRAIWAQSLATADPRQRSDAGEVIFGLDRPRNREIRMSHLAVAADGIEVGSGSAGAVLVARLSHDPGTERFAAESGHDVYPATLLDANEIADPDHDWGKFPADNGHALGIPKPRGKAPRGVAIWTRAADFATRRDIARTLVLPDLQAAAPSRTAPMATRSGHWSKSSRRRPPACKR